MVCKAVLPSRTSVRAQKCNDILSTSINKSRRCNVSLPLNIVLSCNCPPSYITGVTILPTQTMHLFSGNPSKLTHRFVLEMISPKMGSHCWLLNCQDAKLVCPAKSPASIVLSRSSSGNTRCPSTRWMQKNRSNLYPNRGKLFSNHNLWTLKNTWGPTELR